MRNDEILEKIKKLSPTERLSLIEAVLKLVREDFQRLEQPQSPGTNGSWPPIGATRTSSPDYYSNEETSPSSAFDDDDDITTLKKL